MHHLTRYQPWVGDAWTVYSLRSGPVCVTQLWLTVVIVVAAAVRAVSVPRQKGAFSLCLLQPSQGPLTPPLCRLCLLLRFPGLSLQAGLRRAPRSGVLGHQQQQHCLGAC